MEQLRDKAKLVERWTFRWEMMDVLLGGKSPIDLPHLEIETETQAKEFLKGYGYDIDVAPQAKFIHTVFVEALLFLERVLMNQEWQQGIRPPDELIQLNEPLKLLIWASDRKANSKRRRLWSCAVLRLMHTIAHIDGLHRPASLDAARKQIIERFEKALFRSRDGKIWLGREGEAVELENVDWKLRKSRDSVILKLLHKPANVAENIYDLIGVRLVTKTYAEVMMVIKLLRQMNLISFPNANPQRARNSLVDLASFRKQVDILDHMLARGLMSPEEFVEQINKLDPEGPAAKVKTLNPHSGSNFKSIQLTCRHLLRYDDPLTDWTQNISTYLKTAPSHITAEQRAVMEGIVKVALSQYQVIGEEREVRVFFPFEIQIFDSETAKQIRSSQAASHEAYKSSQLKAARKRVLHDVLKNLDKDSGADEA